MIGTLLDKTISPTDNATSGKLVALTGTLSPLPSVVSQFLGFGGTSPHVTHLLPMWNMEATITTASGFTGEFQMGIYDTEFNGQRHTFVGINKGTSPASITLKIGATTCYSHGLPTDFAHTAFTLKIRFVESIMYMTTIETVSGRVLSFKYAYNLNNHYSNPIGKFACGLVSGSVNLVSFGITSDMPTGVEFIVLGDSISAGRKVFPTGYRWPDRLQELFYTFRHMNTRKVYSCASPSARTAHLLNIVPSVTAIAPKTVIILIGDNDPSNDVPTWSASLRSVVTAMLQANAQVIVLAMTGDRDDPHITFSDYIMESLVTDMGTSDVTVIDTLSPMSINFDKSQGVDTQYVNSVDGVHLSISGNNLVATTVLNALT